jgi:F-type H+-transporting ATPase subunit O
MEFQEDMQERSTLPHLKYLINLIVSTITYKAGLLEKVEKELEAFSVTVAKSSNLSAFLTNPTIPRNEKMAKVDNLFSDEKQFSYITRNLFLTLCANGKVSDSLKVIQAYQELMQESRGAVKVTIISAETLKKKQLDDIQKGVMSIVGGGASKTVDLKVVVDESILGGLQVMVGDKFLDLSVASRVNTLTAALDSTV